MLSCVPIAGSACWLCSNAVHARAYSFVARYLRPSSNSLSARDLSAAALAANAATSQIAPRALIASSLSLLLDHPSDPQRPAERDRAGHHEHAHGLAGPALAMKVDVVRRGVEPRVAMQ